MSAFNAGEVEARLVLRRDEFTRELDAAKAEADKFSGKTIEVKAKVGLDDSEAKRKAEGIRRADVSPSGKVRLDDTEAKAKIRALKAEADSIGTKAAQAMSGTPWWLGPGLAALPAAVNILGSAAGAAAGLGTAFAAGGIALATYGKVAQPVLSQAAKAASTVQAAQARYNIAVATGTKQSAAYKAEQKAVLTAYSQMSPAQIALSKQLGDMSGKWQSVQASLTPVIALSVSPWLKGITDGMTAAGPVVHAVAGEVGSLGTAFDSLVRSPSFSVFTRFIASSGSATVGAFGGALLDFVHAGMVLLPQFAPLITRVDQAVASLGTHFLAWSQSQKARDDISKFIAFTVANGPKLGDLLVSIGRALANLAGGLGAGGALEVRLLTGFFNLIARLPKGFAEPVAELAGLLLTISRFGFGRKVISVAIDWAGQGAAALLKLLSGGKIDLGGKFGADAGMQRAGDTMVTAAEMMQRAADTMAGTSAGAPVGSAARDAGTAAETGAAGALSRGKRLAGKVAGRVAGAAAVYAAGSSVASATGGTAGKVVKAGTDVASGALAGSSFGPAGTLAGAAAGALKGIWDTSPAGFGKATAAANQFTAALTALRTASFSSRVGQEQMTAALAHAGVTTAAAKTLTDAYTLAVAANGARSAAAQGLRAQMIADFQRQGYTASQAAALVGQYTQNIEVNGQTAQGKETARANLIADFEKSGSKASAASALVDALSRSVSGNGTVIGAAQAARSNLISDLTAVGVKSSTARDDVARYTDAVQRNGSQSQQAQSARQRLIQDFEKAGVDAHTARQVVGNLTTAIGNLHGKGINITMRGDGSYTIHSVAMTSATNPYKKNSSAGNAGISGRAAKGMYVSQGRPGVDDQLILAQRGEVIVPTPMVRAGEVDHLRGRIPGFAQGGVVGGNLTGPYISGMAGAFEQQMTASMVTAMRAGIKAAQAQATAAAASAGGGPGGPGARPVAQWAGVILQALKLLGQPASWLNTVERRMNQESGGNPTIVNKWDSNWQAGHPSVGLMQVIAGTFASYAGQFRNTGPFEYGVSVNPLANTYAGLNYALHTYGSLSALNRAGGYARGTDGAAAGWALTGEQGPELVKFHGGETVLPAHVTSAVLGGSQFPGYAAGAIPAAARNKAAKAGSPGVIAGLISGAPKEGWAKDVANLKATLHAIAVSLGIKGLSKGDAARLRAEQGRDETELLVAQAYLAKLTDTRKQITTVTEPQLRRQIAALGHLGKLSASEARLLKALKASLAGKEAEVARINTAIYGKAAAKPKPKPGSGGSAGDAGGGDIGGGAGSGGGGTAASQGRFVGVIPSPPGGADITGGGTGGVGGPGTPLGSGYTVAPSGPGGSPASGWLGMLEGGGAGGFPGGASGGPTAHQIERLIAAVQANPAAIGGHVGDALNGTSRSAYSRSVFSSGSPVF